MRLPRPNRRWLQISLSTMLLVIALLSVWLGVRANKARRQGKAIEGLGRFDRSIQFDYQFDEVGRFDPDREPAQPAWLRGAVGEEFFREAVVVDLAVGASRKWMTGEVHATDEDLKLLESLTDVHTLELGNNLEITDKGLVHLRPLHKLETLYLYRTGVRGSGLEQIAELPKLHSLSLASAPLGDEGLEHIGRMTALTWLRLDGTQITDHGLAHLRELQSLTDLSLSRTDITDTGLDHLQQLSKLELLSIALTDVTSAGVSRLRDALPNCHVITSFGLGAEPRTVALWPGGHTPTREELLAKIDELGGQFRIDGNRAGQPIVYFMLFDSELSDESVKELLRHLPDLEELNFRGVLLGDRFLESIAEHAKLRFLSLGDSRITDSGLKYLASLKHLKELDLNDTRITDDGLEHLQNLRCLRDLSISGTRVTNEGLHKLQEALPDCRIHF